MSPEQDSDSDSKQNVPRTRFRFDNALSFNVLNQHLEEARNKKPRNLLANTFSFNLRPKSNFSCRGAESYYNPKPGFKGFKANYS